MCARSRFLRRPRAPLRRIAAACAALALLATSCDGAGPKTHSPAAPNLLLVTVDTLRPDRLSCYGGVPGVGEFLCSLADSGTRFEWAFSTAPYTTPSIASVLTGVYPSAHGVRQSGVSFLRAEVETLPELLQAAGYATAAFISNPVLQRMRQLDQGFEVFDQRMTREERNRPGFSEREARSTCDAALAWAQVAAEPPWFMWVHFQDPHGPYDPPDAAPAHDDPGGTPLPVLEKDNSGLGGIPAYQVLPGVFTREAYEGRYLDEIRYLDGHLKRLVEGLDALGNPPAVLVTADHGEAFGEDGYYFAHGHSVGLDQIRVPLLWRPAVPAATAPAVRRAPVSLVDVAPTLLRAAGLNVPAAWPGEPLPVSGSDAPAGSPDRAIFAEHQTHAAIIVGDSYYSRDRYTPPAKGADPSTAGQLRADRPRTAQLFRSDRTDGTGAAPAYEAGAGNERAAALEPALERFLEDAARHQAGAVHDEVPEEMLEQLRALGYTDRSHSGDAAGARGDGQSSPEVP